MKQRIKLLQAVCLGGEIRVAGTQCDIPASLAKTLIARGVAEPVPDKSAGQGGKQ